ncbi:MAG: LamG domain-containing protein [Phycisphaerae bacterium]|nr:LamG domain-containing protein [Phycisphaerae bacterium]
MMNKNVISTVIAIIALATVSAYAGLDTGLVEYWAFDGDSSAAVTAAHAGTLTTTGTGSGTFVTGKFGQAIDLESSTDNQAYVVVGGDESDFDFVGGSMSISLWYTTESLYVGYQTLVAKGEGGGWRLARRGTTANLVQFAGPGSIIIDGETDQQDGSWHHAVATVDASTGTTSLYIDGVLKGTGSGTIGDRSNAMQIGGNPDAPNRSWAGNFDDVAVWSRALSVDEVTAIWNNGTGASVSSLIPEPATLAILGLGGLGLLRRRRA